MKSSWFITWAIVVFFPLIAAAAVTHPASVHTGSVSGSVLASDGRPAAGVVVRFAVPTTVDGNVARTGRGSDYFPQITAVTNAKGEFLIEGLPVGKVNMTASNFAPPGATGGNTGGRQIGTMEGVVIKEGEVTKLAADIKMDTVRDATDPVSGRYLVGKVSGRIVDQDGKAAAGIMVTTSLASNPASRAGMSMVKTGVTDDKGEFIISDVRVGLTTVVVTSNPTPNGGGARGLRTGTNYQTASIEGVHVRAGEVTRIAADIQLVPEFKIGSISGRALDMDGNPAPFASINVVAADRNAGIPSRAYPASVKANEKGEFVVSGVPVGKVNISARLADGKFQAPSGRGLPGMYNVTRRGTAEGVEVKEGAETKLPAEIKMVKYDSDYMPY